MRASFWLTISLMTLAGCTAPDPVPEAGSGIDLAGFDTSVRPQDDFNAYVNGTWIRDAVIPSDRTSWGSLAMLGERSEENQRAIIEELAARSDLEPGTDAQRVGDFFASYMDTERLDELGPDRDHEAYVWGNAAFACARLIGEAFSLDLRGDVRAE